MPRYEVQRPYSSRRDGKQYGPWVEGDVPDLTDEEVEWLNRDSPGVLAAEKPKPAERDATPAKDRQHRSGRTR